MREMQHPLRGCIFLFRCNMSDLKPSDFTRFPMGSSLQNCESEQVAVNIMVIRKRRGNLWPLSWMEYKAEREKDGGEGCAEYEKSYFTNVIKLIPDAIGAISFSPVWARAARERQSAVA